MNETPSFTDTINLMAKLRDLMAKLDTAVMVDTLQTSCEDVTLYVSCGCQQVPTIFFQVYHSTPRAWVGVDAIFSFE